MHKPVHACTNAARSKLELVAEPVADHLRRRGHQRHHLRVGQGLRRVVVGREEWAAESKAQRQQRKKQKGQSTASGQMSHAFHAAVSVHCDIGLPELCGV